MQIKGEQKSLNRQICLRKPLLNYSLIILFLHWNWFVIRLKNLFFKVTYFF